jgi:hypothetical protein
VADSLSGDILGSQVPVSFLRWYCFDGQMIQGCVSWIVAMERKRLDGREGDMEMMEGQAADRQEADQPWRRM